MQNTAVYIEHRPVYEIHDIKRDEMKVKLLSFQIEFRPKAPSCDIYHNTPNYTLDRMLEKQRIRIGNNLVVVVSENTKLFINVLIKNYPGKYYLHGKTITSVNNSKAGSITVDLSFIA